MPENQSYANHISWWPLVSILGTFSAGKSSFINSWLGTKVQRTGNQAVDDHFTVLAYGRDATIKTLPGQALDSDPRFPFYQISKDIDGVAPGDGARIDKFLQMKVVPSEVLRGKLIIDSPGFDADEQRKSTLRITKHIVRLSDMVLVFFDARHPEVGAMQDTLEHLVKPNVDSMDSQKFLYILNQIDTAASDNNLEEVVAAWRSALVQAGLSAGRFYVHYNDQVAQPIENKDVWNAFKRKRDNDAAHIMQHLADLNTIRSYRIVGNIKVLADNIEEKAIPALKAALKKFRLAVRIADLVLLALIAIGAGVVWYRTGFSLSPMQLGGLVAAAVVVLLGGHFYARRLFTAQFGKRLGLEEYGDMRAAFRKSARALGSVWFRMSPSGWGKRVQRRLSGLRRETEVLIERLNTNNSDPSGEKEAAAKAAAEAARLEAEKAAAAKAEAARKEAEKAAAAAAAKSTSVPSTASTSGTSTATSSGTAAQPMAGGGKS
jgi:GTPase SAR1 family protein